MKTIQHDHKLERGQIIPIVVVALFGLIAMAALILDGGAILLNRRSAQNAADAGALAGARVLCTEENINRTAIETAVVQYTETENHATLTSWDVIYENLGDNGLAKGEIVVTAEIERDSFFAKIFNQDTLSATATAGAGCFPYQPNIVLPIAWSCRPPAAGSASDDCDLIKLDWAQIADVADNYLSPFPLPQGVNPTSGQANDISTDLFDAYGNIIYIIMDSDKVCGEDIICDFSDDGIDRYQLESGGNRGWLNLGGVPGSASASDLKGWIKDGFNTKINTHTWLGPGEGNKASVYDALRTRIDELVWIPVFNVLCPDFPIGNDSCMGAAHSLVKPGVPLLTGEEDIVIGNKTPFYHVVAFAPFFPTCVRKNSSQDCPGFSLALEKNTDLKKSTASFEGYFVFPDSLPEGDEVGSGGASLGIYRPSLTR